jgi:S-adenosylmethionine:tRNA ribosyltransferase-isomerase
MNAADYDYDLPAKLIAQHPPARRTDARMMVVERDRRAVRHRRFDELPDLLQAGDCVVLNDTRVIPARLDGFREPTGGRVEFLFLESRGDNLWDALLRANRRPAVGASFRLGTGRARAILEEDGERGWCRVRIDSSEPFLDVLESEGRPPLPPYITRSGPDLFDHNDRERYQTVFAREPGAVAAPTAGLHFTPEVLQTLAVRGVPHAFVTLHVGIGTFRPVTTDRIEDHHMEAERYVVPPETADRINRTRAAGGRIVAVGSTCVRTLETAADSNGIVSAGEGRTSLFIRPPYRFRAVDALLTNFHLPRSTLLMMVCAFGGTDLIRCAYRDAVESGYRFYSYGDCMLVR